MDVDIVSDPESVVTNTDARCADVAYFVSREMSFWLVEITPD